MGETDYGALFGVDLGESDTADSGEEVTDTPEEGADGAKEQEVTAPDESAADDNADTPAQTDDDNSRFAAARRKAEAERDAAVNKARTEAQTQADEYINGVIAGLGMVNPYTKKPITNKAEYDAYKQQFDIDKRAKVIKDSGMSDEEFKNFVAELPEVKAAREQKEAAEREMKSVREEKAKALVDGQIAEIAKLNPDIKSISDLKNMPSYQRFYDLVKKGNTLVDAYKLANMEDIMASGLTATKQAAINAVSGKNHLDRTTTRGAGAVSVPRDIADAYRAFNPDATDAEIQAHYQKYKKK